MFVFLEPTPADRKDAENSEQIAYESVKRNPCNSANEDLDHSNDNLLRSYFENFTIHGLAKVFTGKKWEKFVWFTVLLASMVFVINASYGFIQEYNTFDILTDIKVKSATKVLLPTVTLCETSPAGFTCYENMTILGGTECARPVSPYFPTGNHLYEHLYSDSRMYAILHPVYPERCIVINPHGNMTAATFPELGFRSSFNRGKVSIYIQDHGQMTIGIADKPTSVFKLMIVDVKLSNKQMIWRMPSPYSSMCSNGNDNSSIFPKPYTMTKCRNTCAFKMMLSECGDVIQQWKIYKPRGRVTNKTKNVHKCLRKLFERKFDNLAKCDCPVSCFDMYIDTTVDSIYGTIESLSFQYLSNTITEIKERPAYPASQFVTDIGGWLSLFTGISVLSLLKLCIFFALIITALCQGCLVFRKSGRSSK